VRAQSKNNLNQTLKNNYR